MKRMLLLAAAVAAIFAVVPAEAPAVDVSNVDGVWIIETDTYSAHFREMNRAGYSEIYSTRKVDAVSLLGPDKPRSFYHSAMYDGWVPWGNATDVEEVMNANKTLIMRYEVNDGNSKKYIVTATYWDGAPYWKHELVVEAANPVVSFSDAHEPSVGAAERHGSQQPNIWRGTTRSRMSRLRTRTGTSRSIRRRVPQSLPGAWAPDGRMHLNHNDLGVELEKGERSDPLIYYLATRPWRSGRRPRLSESGYGRACLPFGGCVSQDGDALGRG